MDIEIGRINSKWNRDYGIETGELRYDGKPTDYRVLTKDGEFVAVVGKYYKILPNEVALELARSSADELGFEELTTHTNDRGTRVTAMFTYPEEIEITEGDTANVGFTIVNSIDRSTSFGVEGFTYRGICGNGVIMGKKEIALSARKHTTGLKVDPKSITKRIETVLVTVRDVINAYQRLAKVKLNEEIADRIAESRLPQKVLPPYIEVEKGELQSLDINLSQWQAYNDISANIWHNTKTKLQSKRMHFQQLHKAFQIAK